MCVFTCGGVKGDQQMHMCVCLLTPRWPTYLHVLLLLRPLLHSWPGPSASRERSEALGGQRPVHTHAITRHRVSVSLDCIAIYCCCCMDQHCHAGLPTLRECLLEGIQPQSWCSRINALAGFSVVQCRTGQCD